ncbi:MAG: TonB family protein [bacterium]|nr:TonB family protein [bacterium]
MKRPPAAIALIALALLAAVAGAVLLGGRGGTADVAPAARPGGSVPDATASAIPAPSAAQESGLPEEEAVVAPRPQEERPAATQSPPRRAAAKGRPRAPQAQTPQAQTLQAAAPAAGSGGPSTAAAPQPGPGAGAHGADAAAPLPAAAPAPLPAHPPAPSPLPPPPVTAAPIVTPPVPVALHPPRHPDAWRVIVEPPGLAAEARPEQASARVRLRLLVREDGAVGRVEVAVSSGRPELDAAAAAAAYLWQFLPARRDGAPIASVVLIWVAFVSAP